MLWQDLNKKGWREKTAYYWKLKHRPKTGFIRFVHLTFFEWGVHVRAWCHGVGKAIVWCQCGKDLLPLSCHSWYFSIPQWSHIPTTLPTASTINPLKQYRFITG